MKSHYGELWRNKRLIKQGIYQAKKHRKDVRVLIGGGAVSVFYEQLGKSLPKGTIISIGEGEPLLEKLLSGQSIDIEMRLLSGDGFLSHSIKEKINIK